MNNIGHMCVCVQLCACYIYKPNGKKKTVGEWGERDRYLFGITIIQFIN